MPVCTLASSAVAGSDLPPPRAYGSAPDDLDSEFDFADRPALVTALLARCCERGSTPASSYEEAAWDLRLSTRLLRLLRIVELTTKTEFLTVTTACPSSECQQLIELILPFSELGEQADHSSPEILVQLSDHEAVPVSMRLPTGRDQAEWRRRTYVTAQEALAAIVQSLIVPRSEAAATVGSHHIEPLSAAMEDADPLLAFEVESRCPHCQRVSAFPVDLELVALQQLSRQRRALIQNIHHLALNYGWTEAEVLAVPPSRRAEYGKLIDARAEVLG